MHWLNLALQWAVLIALAIFALYAVVAWLYIIGLFIYLVLILWPLRLIGLVVPEAEAACNRRMTELSERRRAYASETRRRFRIRYALWRLRQRVRRMT